MGAQGAPYSAASESVAGGGQGARESVLTDAQTRLMPDELDSAPLTEELDKINRKSRWSPVSPGIMDTGARRSLLSATVTSACACEPTTINAVLYWGQTNGGSLWRLADCNRRTEKMPSVVKWL